MKWTKYTIDTTSDATELICYLLGEQGIDKFEIEDHVPLSETDKKKMFVDILPEDDINNKNAKIHFYIEENDDKTEDIPSLIKSILEEVQSYGTDIGSGTFATEEIGDIDWMNAWKENYHSFRATSDFIIRPDKDSPLVEDYKDGDIIIDIDPGIAFGTGSHETTRLCMEAISKYVNDGCLCLDMGCGSGILGIAAAKKGAGKLYFCDVDKMAVKTARENAIENGCNPDLLTFLNGDILDFYTTDFSYSIENPMENDALLTSSELHQALPEDFDVIVANILADVIIPMNPHMIKHLKKDGIYITSGILDEKADEVEKSLKETGFEILEKNVLNEWVSFVAKK